MSHTCLLKDSLPWLTMFGHLTLSKRVSPYVPCAAYMVLAILISLIFSTRILILDLLGAYVLCFNEGLPPLAY